jgi:hypothetical protein
MTPNLLRLQHVLEEVLQYLGPDEVLPDLTPAMWIAGAFAGSKVIGDALEADKRNKLRTQVREELQEVTQCIAMITL